MLLCLGFDYLFEPQIIDQVMHKKQ